MLGWVSTLLSVLLSLTAFFLIVLVLIQRGKGGGLAGAFGGMGGQSAFGTKAGDLFTKITIGVASFWIILCIFTVWISGAGQQNPLKMRARNQAVDDAAMSPGGDDEPEKPAEDK